MAYMVMAYIVMAYMVMTYVVMAYAAMAHIVMALPEKREGLRTKLAQVFVGEPCARVTWP